MRVLVACEFSGRVRDAFLAEGHDAVSCDLLPSETAGPHIVGDIRELIYSEWDLMVAFPPCTDLSVVGAAQWKAKQADGRQQRALGFVRLLMDVPIPRVAIENPVGRINTAIRRPDQIINPWQFGDPWKKRTCLWLKNLPLLEPTNVVAPRGSWVGGGSLAKGGAVSESGAYQGRKFADDVSARNKTFLGIAAAMASQWGSVTTSNRKAA